jgi:hypothetical protein
MSGGNHRWFRKSTRKKRHVTRDNTNNNNNNNNIKIITVTIINTTVPERHTLQDTWHKR